MSDIPLENLDFAKVGAMQQVLLDTDFSFNSLLLDSFIFFMSLCRAEEHFLVIFLCWRSSRIWTGTQRSLL